METINRRIGYFLRESPSSVKGQSTQFLIRYFMIDNSNTIYYTDNYSHLVHLVRSSNNISEIFEKAAKLDQYFARERAAEFKVGEIKKYKNPEHLTFLNQVHFEVLITFLPGSSDPNMSQMSAGTPTKPDEPRKHLFFAYKDSCLPLLHRFVSGQDKRAAQLDEQALLVWPGIEPVTSLAKKKAESEKLIAKYAEHVSNLQIVIDVVNRVPGGKPALDSLHGQNATTSNPSGGQSDHHETQNGVNSIQETTEVAQQPHETAANSESNPDQPAKINDDASNRVESMEEGEAEGKQAVGGQQEKQANELGGGQVSKKSSESPRNGKGKEHLTDSVSYVGEFRNDKRHGLGYFVLAEKGMCYVESLNGRVSGI